MIGQHLSHKYLPLVLVSILLITLVGLSACATPAPAPAPVTVTTLAQACDAVDKYLYALATTPEAKRLLAVYKENMWGCRNCTMVVDCEGHWLHVYSETEYIGFPVEEYIVQHIFDSEFTPGSEGLKQILRSYPSIYDCGPEWNEEISYPVTWTVQAQSRTVTAADGNALRVEAELIE